MATFNITEQDGKTSTGARLLRPGSGKIFDNKRQFKEYFRRRSAANDYSATVADDQKPPVRYFWINVAGGGDNRSNGAVRHRCSCVDELTLTCARPWKKPVVTRSTRQKNAKNTDKKRARARRFNSRKHRVHSRISNYRYTNQLPLPFRNS